MTSPNSNIPEDNGAIEVENEVSDVIKIPVIPNTASVNDENQKVAETRSLLPGNIRRSKINSTLFSAVITAFWDNVMGPVISKIWLGNGKVEITNWIATYVSNHTLGGELCRQTDKQNIHPVFYVLADSGYIFYSVIYNGFWNKDQTISSITFVMAHSDIDRFLLIQQFMHRHVKMISIKYRVLQQKSQRYAMREFSSLLKQFVKVVDSLEIHSIPLKLCLKDTIFGESEVANDYGLLDSNFLMRALTSHFQTCGCTVVIGTTSDKINLMVRTLGLFLSASERYCSRYASHHENFCFTRDLYLQGIIKIEDKLNIASKDVLLNTYPVTIIDVDEKTVKQKPLLNEHSETQKNFLKVELNYLLQGTEAPVYPFSKLFSGQFGDISINTQHFISELFRSVPNKCSLRKNCIQVFKEMLHQQANSLIAYVQAKSNHGRLFMRLADVQQMKQDLSFKSEADFRIVLAEAEKIRPGIAVFLLGKLFSNDESYKDLPVPKMWR